MRPYITIATTFWLILSLILLSEAAEAQQNPASVPQFRTVSDAPLPPPPSGEIRLLADGDFAPYSFQSSSGAPAGLTVELALAACKEARMTCTVATRPYAELLPALARGEGMPY